MASASEVPIHLHIDASLSQYNLSLVKFLAANPQYTNVVVSAFTFDTHEIQPAKSSHPVRLLMVQRAAHERSFANLWEIPGGSSDTSDPTILHSLAREVFEETGLKMTRVVGQAGDLVQFQTGWGPRRKTWAKLSFEIEVAETQTRGRSSASMASQDTVKEGETSQTETKEPLAGSAAEVQEIEVTIDPSEHQKYAWATLEEIQAGKYAIATREQRELIIETFQARCAKVSG